MNDRNKYVVSLLHNIYIYCIYHLFIHLSSVYILIASYDNTRNDNNCFLCCWIDWLVSLHSFVTQFKISKRVLEFTLNSNFCIVSPPPFSNIYFLYFFHPPSLFLETKKITCYSKIGYGPVVCFFFMFAPNLLPQWYDRPRCLLPIWLFYTPPKFTN